MLSLSWIITGLVIIINLTLTLFFIVYFYDERDVGIITLFIFMSFFVIFSIYHLERSMKFNFIRLKSNEKMNQDLKDLLINFPKPILLLDENNNQIVLANK